jgi:arginase
VTDLGNIAVKVPESIHLNYESTTPNRKFAKEIAETCKQLAKQVKSTMQQGHIPLVLGGDHSISIGTVAGVSGFFHEKNQKIGLIWLDAHADINTPETSPSGNVHGMPLAHILGLGAEELKKVAPMSPMVDVRNAVLIGIRDLDPEEKNTIKKLGLKAFTMRDVDEMGLRRVMEEALAIATAGTAGFHLTCDMDWMDPTDAPGVGTPVPGGATYREGHLAMEVAADTGKMLSLEVVEVNPVLDHENQTAQLACEMILSAFGKKIL